jgi:hypothetical protein
MRDAGRQEQARKLRRFLRASHVLLDSLVVIDRSLGRDQLISFAAPDDRLAAAIAEGRQIRVIGADHDSIFLERLVPETLIGVRRNSGYIVQRVFGNKVFQPIRRECEWKRLQWSAARRGQRPYICSAGSISRMSIAISGASRRKRRSNSGKTLHTAVLTTPMINDPASPWPARTVSRAA